ncbi:NUDIX domain-containing protein [Candidatus Woesearchaeota archaeon]|nr:NUDIX domain-containing protein [Candidatus Woesearchaeota archaeon]
MRVTQHFLSTVYIIKGNKVLMTWNKKMEDWIPLGGHIDENELPCDSVIREAKEESGLDIELVDSWDTSKSKNLVQPLHLHLDHVADDHKHIDLVYVARVIGGEKLDQSDEGTALKWFSKQEIERMELIPNVKEMALRALELCKNL